MSTTTKGVAFYHLELEYAAVTAREHEETAIVPQVVVADTGFTDFVLL